MNTAVEVGVVTKVQMKQAQNPNKWHKHLAPWFTDTCREAKKAYKSALYECGKDSREAEAAFHTFRHTCNKSRIAFAQKLPEMLKYRPKQFWGMIKAKDNSTEAMDLPAFAEFNAKLFYDPSLEPDTYTPLQNVANMEITKEELQHTIVNNFKANKSSGMSDLPLQTLRHLGTKAIASLADFLNESALK